MSREPLTTYFWSIENLFQKRFSVPVYQRPYSWGKEEVECLLKDISNSYNEYDKLDDEGKAKSYLYIGNVILQERFDFYDVIDGQQRITTLCLILIALYEMLFELNAERSAITRKLQESLWKADSFRDPDQNKRLFDLGSVDKQIMLNIFDQAFSTPEDLSNYIENYNTTNAFEDNVKTAFLEAYKFIDKNFSEAGNKLNAVLAFTNYILLNVKLIAIINYDSEFKAFSIFEAINSKGKKLEDIDLIKTRIFSTLHEKDYAAYLTKWGDLIVKTEDRLYDFLKTYIKANIVYNSQNITFNAFKKMGTELCQYFDKTDLADAYKSLIDDMLRTVENYMYLFDLDKVHKILSNNKLRFYYTVFIKLEYEHPRPLFYRLFCEYKKAI